MRMALFAALAVAVPSGIRADAPLPPVDPLVTMNVHLTEPSYLGCDAVDDAAIGVCENIATTYGGSEAWAWLILAKDGGMAFDGIPGVGGVQFGIEYEETVDIAGWTLCTGGSQIPEDDFIGRWPESGTGNAVTWAGGCYRPPGEVAKIGFLTTVAGSSGVLATRADPRTELSGIFEALVVSCVPEAFLLCDAAMGFGIVGTGSTPVCGNPCEATPIEGASWSRLKSLF